MKISIITPTTQVIGWNNPADVGISRIGVNIIGFGNGTASDITANVQAGTVALGGATIGSNALAVTGTVNLSGNTTLGSTSQLLWSTDLILTRAAAATLQLGASDAASPVAQTLQFQNGAGTNIPAVNATIVGPLATGNSTNGDIIFKTGVLGSSGTSPGTKTTAVTIKGETQALQVSAAGSASAPAISLGATNYGFYQGSSQLGITIAGVDKLNYGVTNAGAWTTPTDVFIGGSAKITVDCVIGATHSFAWSTTRSLIQSPADGNIQLNNSAASTFGMLLFGGSTSSFPAIKRNSAALNFRLGDDSADAAITSGPITSTGVSNVASATATPAGGSTSARLLFGTTAGFGIYYGSGAPSALTAAHGSIYLCSDGSTTSTRMYVNTDGSTTWTSFTTAA